MFTFVNYFKVPFTRRLKTWLTLLWRHTLFFAFINNFLGEATILTWIEFNVHLLKRVFYWWYLCKWFEYFNYMLPISCQTRAYALIWIKIGYFYIRLLFFWLKLSKKLNLWLQGALCHHISLKVCILTRGWKAYF